MPSEAGLKPQKEINRLKSQIKRFQRDRDKAFPELGRDTYQAFIEGRLKDAALGESCGRLKAIDTQIEQLNAQITGLQAQAQQMKAAPPPAAACPSCGAAVTSGTKFCGNCGVVLAQPAAQTPVGSVCPSCGSALQPGTRFCGECGGPAPEFTAPPPQAPQVQAPAPPPTAAPPAPPPPPPAPDKPVEAQVVAASEKCPRCGTRIEEEDAVFCGECGARLKS